MRIPARTHQTDTDEQESVKARTTTEPSVRGDVLTVAVGALLVLSAAGLGWWFGSPLIGPATWWPPLFAKWLPHVGPGTVPAVAVAALVVAFGPTVAQRLAWRWLLAAAYATALTWTLALGLVDGWRAGIADRLLAPAEYLTDLPRITDVPAFIQSFTAGIVDYTPDSWTIQVAGHPPGATLVFVLLDRIGLGGGGPAGVLCAIVGTSAVVAVAVTIRLLGEEATARSAISYLVLFPGAVWMAATGDGLFTGVIAWGVAAIAYAVTRRGPLADLAALTGGLVLGLGLYLSYGYVLVGLFPLALAAATGRIRPLVVGGLGVLAVIVAFTWAGFWWLDGYELVKVRYYQGVASLRTYGYWLWGNLACLVFIIGPAALVGLRRTFADLPLKRLRADAGHWRSLARPVPLLVLTALAVMVVANLSGLSKSEVERIWLPFAIWVMAGCALLPVRHTRWWLAAQAVLALAVNHLLWTGS